MKQSQLVVIEFMQQVSELHPAVVFAVAFVVAFFLASAIQAWKQVRCMPDMQPTKFVVASSAVFLALLFVFIFTLL